ncbi:Fur family transcriptional regulator [uncultured Sphingomonas sp.]|uniref:Fur family transcriptional regulator n=1 Tax=uncultured Sphingomonas sp. TaxID=158754 RepID=UPI0035C9774C
MAETRRRKAGAINRSILGLLGRTGLPLSANAIVQELAALGERICPSQAFRALARLCDDRLIHRVELVNGYVAGQPGQTINLVCDGCGKVARVAAPDLFRDLATLARHAGLIPGRLVVESTGLCGQCGIADRQ